MVTEGDIGNMDFNNIVDVGNVDVVDEWGRRNRSFCWAVNIDSSWFINHLTESKGVNAFKESVGARSYI